MPTTEKRLRFSYDEIKRIKEVARELIPRFAAKITPMYKQHGYFWGAGSHSHIPTIIDISDTCWMLLNDILDTGVSDCSTGRIEVRYQYGDIEFLFVPECETIYSHTIGGKG